MQSGAGRSGVGGSLPAMSILTVVRLGRDWRASRCAAIAEIIDPRSGRSPNCELNKSSSLIKASS